MTWVIWTLMMAAAAADKPAPQVGLSVWAVQACEEKRAETFFGQGLETVRDALTDLPFDTFHLLHFEETRQEMDKTWTVALDERYRLKATPLGQGPLGRVRVELQIELLPKSPEGKPVNVLSTRVRMKAGEKVTLRGLQRDSGELAVVVQMNK